MNGYFASDDSPMGGYGREREDSFSVLGNVTGANQEMMTAGLQTGAEGFAKRQEAKIMAKAYRDAAKAQARASGGGIGGSLLSGAIGLLNPFAGAAAKSLFPSKIG